MRRITRLAPLLALGLTLSFAGACRQATAPEASTPEREREREVEIALPDPLVLPANPKAASWVAQPTLAVAMVAPYSPAPIDLRVGVEQALATVTAPALAAELARAVDLGAPFTNVILDDGQEVIRLSLASERRAALSGRLTELEPSGEFGAVRLPAPGGPGGAKGREWLAWIDEDDGGTLVLANSLPGVVTGRHLAAAYGDQPIYFTADLAGDWSNLAIDIELPFGRVTGRGDISALVIEAQALDGVDPFAGLPIAPGTLGGLLDGSQITAGVSTRYADHKQTVNQVISGVNSSVAQLPFLVRGIGEGIAAKLNTALRTWDGRVLAALGPRGHLRLAVGATDVNKSRIAVIRLLQAVVDNVSMARNFTDKVPKMTLRRRVATGDGEDVELFVIHDASSVASELRPLADRENRLNIAMAWSERAGGGMFVIGPDAARELGSWLDQTKASAPNDATRGQLLAASFAGEPEQLQALLKLGDDVQLAQLLGLAANGPQWRLAVNDEGAGRYIIHLATPGPAKPARAPVAR